MSRLQTHLTLATRGASGEPRASVQFELTPAFLELYELGEVLGAGAMGMVVRAVQRSVNRPVAIKFLKLSGPEHLARFLREGRVQGRIAHPAVVRAIDCGDVNGCPYLVTELLEGGTLRDRLESGPLPWSQAVDHAVSFLEGLAACHDAGIIHRDLKPENILYDDDDRPRIADLGIASDGQDAYALTATGAMVGTPVYMAPEQMRGETSVKSDVWAMAAILHEMIEGKRPFVARSLPELVAAHQRPPARLELAPRAVADAVAHALSSLPSDRPESARAFAEALRLAQRRASSATRVPSGRASRPLSSRVGMTPVPAPAHAPGGASPKSRLGLAAVLVGCALMVPAYRSWRPTPAAGLAPIVLSEPTSSTAQSDPSLTVLPIAKRTFPEFAHVGGDPTEERLFSVRRLPFRHRDLTSAAFSMDGRTAVTTAGTAVRIWRTADATLLFELNVGGSELRCSALTPDGAHVAVSAGNYVVIVDLTGPPRAERVPMGMEPLGLRLLAPDRLVLRTTRAIWLWERGRAPREIATSRFVYRSLTASADGRRIAAGREDGLVEMVDLPTGVVRRWDAHHVETGRAQTDLENLDGMLPGAVRTLAFSPDGTRLASSGHGSVRVFDALTTKPLHIVELGLSVAHAIAFRPDGAEMAVSRMPNEGDETRELLLCDTSGGTPTRVASDLDGAYAIGYQPGGKNLIVQTAGGLQTYPARAAAPVSLATLGTSLVASHWLPDGRLLVSDSVSGRSEVWLTGAQRRESGFPEHIPASAVLRSSGTVPIAYFMRERRLRVLNALTGAPLPLDRLKLPGDLVQVSHDNAIVGLLAHGTSSDRIAFFTVAGQAQGAVMLPGGPYRAITFDARVRRVAAAGPASIAVFDVVSQREIHRWPLADAGVVSFLAFDVEGNSLTAVTRDVHPFDTKASHPGGADPPDPLLFGGLPGFRPPFIPLPFEGKLTAYVARYGKKITPASGKLTGDQETYTINQSGDTLVASGPECARVYRLTAR